ncbi:yipf5 [Scenedesmus sp. PABB004]|nr:yipf5 [Scenedesmus sp. PABB004]
MEFGMKQSPSFGSAAGQPMEWYSAGPNSGGYGGGGSAAFYAPPPGAGASAAYSSGFEDEPPLLEELGIDIPSILQKTKAILLHQMRAPCLDDLDFGGALIFLLLLGGLHLLLGKMHFGVLLGWSAVQSGVLWFVVNQIASNEASEHRALDLYSCCCIVGYGLLPLILLSLGVLLMPRGPVSVVLAVLAAAWSALTAAKVLARISHALAEVRSLVLVPCFLLYGSFALLTVY